MLNVGGFCLTSGLSLQRNESANQPSQLHVGKDEQVRLSEKTRGF